DAVLDDLGQAAAVLAVGQRGQDGGVAPDADRLVEGADEVLGPRVVDADLAADGAVHHGEEGGRHHEQRQAAVGGGGEEAGQGADEAAADGHDERLAVGVQVHELVVEAGGAGEGLLGFARRQGGEVGAEAGGGQRRGGGLGVRPDVGVGDDEGQRAGGPLPRERPQAGGVAAGDNDVVAALAELDAHRVHGCPRTDGGRNTVEIGNSLAGRQRGAGF